MDRSTDFEMPSPKRVRLEVSEHENAFDPTTPADSIDDLYGSPLVQSQSPIKGSPFLAPSLKTPTSSTDEKLFQLPGLGALDGEPISSSQTLQNQSETPPFSEAGLNSSKAHLENEELEDGQKFNADGGLGVAFDKERIVDVQITESRSISPASSEILMDKNPAIATTHKEKSPVTGTPRNQDGTWPDSEPAQATIEWHSSGTIIDNRMWLGVHAIEEATSQAPDPIASTNAAGSEDVDVSQVDDDVQERLCMGANTIASRSKKMTVTEQDLDNDIGEAEFEIDSSPLVSDSSSDDSTDTSSSDDSDADDYKMLSPAEQARRLMAEDGVSDDDDNDKGRKKIAEVPRTLNEKPDEVVPKPDIVVTEQMRIEELGIVENTIENVVLIKANISGEYQVLESGSVLCLEDRSVIGIISETLGRVQQPYYSVRFTNAKAIGEAGIAKGTKIFYVEQHSTTVFTQPLKAFKGSDASNLHDEEVGDDELEFSDDEAEAEHKRQVKQQKTAKRHARDGQPDGFSRGPQQRPGKHGPRTGGGLHPIREHPPKSTEAALNYDDAGVANAAKNDDEDGPYTPLARPSNLHEILAGNSPPADDSRGLGNNSRGRGDNRSVNRGRGGGRGRGGNRGMRDSQRGGGKQNWKDQGSRGGKGHAYGHSIPPKPQTNGFSPSSQTNGLPPRPATESSGHQRPTMHQANGYPHPQTQHSPNPPPAYQMQQQQQQQQQRQPQFHAPSTYPPQYPTTTTTTAYNNQPYIQQHQHPQHHQQQMPHQSYPPTVPPLPQPNYYHHQQYAQPSQQQPIPSSSTSHHTYMPPHFPPRPDMSSSSSSVPRPPPPQQQYSPSIPAGAHINPNFFKQQAQSAPQGWQMGYNNHNYNHQQQQQQRRQFMSPAPAGNGNGMGTRAPASTATNLPELLRGLGQGNGAN